MKQVSSCRGTEPVTAKVDSCMKQYLDMKAEERGITRSECLRRILEAYGRLESGSYDCPHCGEVLVIDS